jgi:hypothetical protein
MRALWPRAWKKARVSSLELILQGTLVLGMGGDAPGAVRGQSHHLGDDFLLGQQHHVQAFVDVPA